MNNYGKTTENTSGQGKLAYIPPEIKKWNWGAFFLTWIWGLCNEVYISLIALVPYVNIVMAFILGAKGNEWAWRNKRWDSIEDFNRIQKRWAYWGLAIIIILILLTIGMILIGNFHYTCKIHHLIEA
jgi:hypothetical protein